MDGDVNRDMNGVSDEDRDRDMDATRGVQLV